LILKHPLPSRERGQIEVLKEKKICEFKKVVEQNQFPSPLVGEGQGRGGSGL
jgi:hypothetical protein